MNKSNIVGSDSEDIYSSKTSCPSFKRLAVLKQECEALKAALSISNAELAEKNAQIESYKSDLLKAKEEIHRLHKFQ